MDASLSLDGESRQKLKTLLEEQNTVCAGQLFVLGLDSLMDELGEGWERYQARVYDTLERIMERALEKSEVFLRVAAGKYVVVFHDRDQSAAQVVCQKILSEVRKTFLGTQELSGLDVDSMVMALNPSAFAQSMGLELDDKAADEQGAALGQPIEAPKKRKLTASKRKSRKTYDANVEDIWYLPIWDLKNQMVYNYQPTILHAIGARRTIGYAALPDPHDIKQVRAMDLHRLEEALKTLSASAKQDMLTVMTIPVHFKTLDRGSTRAEFHRLCLRVSKSLRRSVMFKLTGMTPGRPPWILFELANMLSQLGRAVIAEIEPGWQNLGSLASLPINGIEVNLERTRSSSESLAKELQKISTFCNNHRMNLSVSGVRSADFASVAQNLGAKWLSGHYVLGAVDQPLPPMNFRQLASSALLSCAGGEVVFGEDYLDEQQGCRA